MEPSGSMRDRKHFTDLTNTTIQGTQTPHHVDPKERDRERKRFLVATMSDEKRIEYNRTICERHDIVHMEADENDGWLHRGDLGENKYRLYVGTTESDGDVGLINDEAPCGEMEDLCDQSCISPLCEGEADEEHTKRKEKKKASKKVNGQKKRVPTVDGTYTKNIVYKEVLTP
ncbi:hypothetical protein SETIT_2G323600v2 [Setaria italica]|nr:hypothetical protein SETIT_2G323600v2 [Setaria italica]